MPAICSATKCNKIHVIIGNTAQSSSASWFGFGLLLLFLFLLGFLLLLLVLLLILALQVLDLFVGLGDGLEEAFKASLLRTLEILLQSGCTAANSVLAESFLGDEELDKSFNVRSLPFEVAVSVIGGMNVRVKK